MSMKFIQEYPAIDGVTQASRVEVEIHEDSSLDTVPDFFESFIKAAGYHLPEGCHIGYEYEDEYNEGGCGGECADCGCYNLDEEIEFEPSTDFGYSTSYTVDLNDPKQKAFEWSKAFEQQGSDSYGDVVINFGDKK
jgi:hypothetical protein